MKKLFKLAVGALVMAAALISCKKDASIDAYYTFDISYKVAGSSGDNVSAIETALGNRYNTQYKTESEARKEWDAFLAAVDDNDVIINGEASYYTVSLVLKDLDKDYTYVTKKTLAKVTWNKTGRHVE
ncbi:MAG: hypothetical protein ACI3ZL_07910 [Candidatus Cryptobacteroides sp.]